MSDDWFLDRALSRRSWFGVTGATLAAASLGACTSAHKFSITVPTGLTVTTETPRPEITDPNAALDRLLAGNRRFVAVQMRHPDQDPERRLKVSGDQDPYAVIVACSDSRLSPEMLFDEGLGDLFAVRVAGGIVDADGLGSVEYAVEHLDTLLVMVVGHQRCGAVTATLASIQHHSTPRGSVAALVAAITPGVKVAEQRPGDLVDNTVRANAEMSRDAVMKSAELTSRLSDGKLKVVAAYYSLDDGRVSLL